MKTFMKGIIKVCLILFLPFQVYAWNGVGHMLVATIAYDHLQPDAKMKVDNLIATFNHEYPKISTLPQAALWADELRGQRIETFTHWHYINLTLSGDGTIPNKNMIDSDNAVWAVNHIISIIGNEKANPYERARFLAFLIHIVADLHQPLHAVARVTALHPGGDEGGNLFKIDYPGSINNLHALWDDGLGLFGGGQSPENISAIAQMITTAYPATYFDLKIKDLKPMDWANEDLELCKTIVYNTVENQAPSSSYMEIGRRTAEQQAALAGYRLAAMLNQVLA